MARHYKQGTARTQEALLPPRVEDYVHTNPVRAIDAFVDTLDLPALGFTNSCGDLTAGQPAFDPAALLKLYLYGYTNRVHSSRRQERECRRNLEVIWLLEGLTPSYRTIAEFRRVNGKALKAANRELVLLCKALGLLGGQTVGIDGSFFNASASDASILTKKQLEVDLKPLEREIDSYRQVLDDNDAQEGRTEEPSPFQRQPVRHEHNASVSYLTNRELRRASLQCPELGQSDQTRRDAECPLTRPVGQGVLVDGAHAGKRRAVTRRPLRPRSAGNRPDAMISSRNCRAASSGSSSRSSIAWPARAGLRVSRGATRARRSPVDHRELRCRRVR